jgi:inorganic pyrophosphatase
MQITQIDYHKLDAYDDDNELVNVIVETPKGSRNKLKFEEKLGIFVLSSIIGEGLRFPFDFGFVPSTKGEDGDPLDILLLMDEPTYPGVLVEARLIGVVEAEQGKKKKRNDRLIAVAHKSIVFKHVQDAEDLHEDFITQLGEFFRFYNEDKNKKFKILGTRGRNHAHKLIEEGARRFKKSND